MADGFIGHQELWATLIQTNAANISQRQTRDLIFYPRVHFLGNLIARAPTPERVVFLWKMDISKCAQTLAWKFMSS